jgi:steroid delta-isomerase-like uncharacterized protein
MPDLDLVQLTRELLACFERNDHAKFRQHVTAESVLEEVGSQRTIHGVDEWLRLWDEWKGVLPDAKGTVVNTFAAGSTVIQEVIWEGTHKGRFEIPGIGSYPASGNKVSFRGLQVVEYEGDKVKVCRHYFDMLGVLRYMTAESAPLHARAT